MAKPLKAKKPPKNPWATIQAIQEPGSITYAIQWVKKGKLPSDSVWVAQRSRDGAGELVAVDYQPIRDFFDDPAGQGVATVAIPPGAVTVEAFVFVFPNTHTPVSDTLVTDL